MNKTRTSYKQKFVPADNPGQNIWNSVKKANTTGQEQKTFTTAYFLAVITKNFISRKKDWSLSPIFVHFFGFPNIFQFPRMLSLKLLDNS